MKEVNVLTNCCGNKIWKVFMFLNDHDVIGCDCYSSYEKAKRAYIELCECVAEDGYDVEWNSDWKESDYATSDINGQFDIYIEEGELDPD